LEYKMLEVVFRLAAHLTETEPSFTFIQGIDGEIRDDESKIVIGQISASLVQCNGSHCFPSTFSR
jgi:hypothetical protein